MLGVVGLGLRLFSLAFLAPLILALTDGEWAMARHFAISMGLTLLTGVVFAWQVRSQPRLRRSEALAVVAGTWLIVGHFASLPYIFEGLAPVDALFESISGFTTTGATILTDWEHPRAFYLWRAMTQWFGGVGVIALFIVILPRLGIAGRQLFFAEASGTLSDPIAPQIRQVAARLWSLYVGLTVLEILLLRFVAEMPLFESVCHSLTTMPAGGFSPNPRSIAGYDNPTAEWIITVFMTLAGTSFLLLYRGLLQRPKAFFRDAEFRFYIMCLGLGGLAVAVILSGGFPTLENLRAGMFQSASLISSTGFASADYNLWVDAAKVVLLIVMVIGGCAGSAAGGAKAIRHLIVIRFLRREVTQVLHPQAVLPLRYNDRVVPLEIVRTIVTLVVLYLAGYLVLAAVLVILGQDLVTGFSAALACLGNIGPGFGPAGPMGSYAEFSTGSKVILTIAMWVGRLEIVTVLALLHPDVWKHLQWRGRRMPPAFGGERS